MSLLEDVNEAAPEVSDYAREDAPGAEEAALPPCPEGHDARQAAWLGCTPEQCRPGDVLISEQCRAMRGE